MNINSKIYIAGHRGMVGGSILRKLNQQGYKNLIYKTRTELNLLDQNKVNSFFDEHKPDIVFCAAAIVGGIKASMENQTKFLYENLQIQNNVINAAYENKTDRFIYFSSSCMYPTNAPQPMKEECILTGKLEPTCEGYAIAKTAGTLLLDYMFKEKQFNGVTIVPCNLYGPNDSFDPQHSHVLAALVRKFYEAKKENKPCVSIWGTGNARRELIHVDDCADISIKIAKNYDLNGWINVGCGNDHSIEELAHLIKNIIKYDGKIVFDKTKPDRALRKCTDISKLKKLNLKPNILIEDGILEMINIYKNLYENNSNTTKSYN